MLNKLANTRDIHTILSDCSEERGCDVNLSYLARDDPSRPAHEGPLATPRKSQRGLGRCSPNPRSSVPLIVQSSRFIERLLFTHCSSAGPERDVVLFGHPWCRRCAFLILGVALGCLFGITWPPTAWIALAAVPAIIDAANEKILCGQHCPLRLSIVSILAGGVLGVYCEWLCFDGSIIRLILSASALFMVVKLRTAVRRRSAASETSAYSE